MNMYIGITDKLLLIITIYAAMFLYSPRVSWRKTKSSWWFVLCVAALVGLSFLSESTKNLLVTDKVTLILKNGVDIILISGSIASMLFLKKYSRPRILFVGCAAYATAYLANNIFSLIASLLVGPSGAISVSQAAEISIRVVIFAIIYSALYAVCWFLCVKKQHNGLEYAVDKSVFAIFILIFAVNIFTGSYEQNATFNVVLFNKVLSCVLILFVLFKQSNYINSREENARLQYIMEKQKIQYSIAKENIDQVNVRAHDLKHFVEIFKSAGSVPDDVLSEVTAIGNEYDSTYDTGSKALDITLTEKCAGFAANHIAFSVIADGSCLSFMSDVDIYVLFGNLLENAREAVLGIADADNRIIGMHIKKTEQFISIHIENTFGQKPIFEDGLPQTSKSDKDNHGFGTKSIQLVVEKYRGTMKMDCDDKLFSVDIAFFAQ
ncbi:MAG: sensor histidine kinase [Eubacterium sp.]|nr:sensor histidine kinase [Eubacterium sp.]